MSRQEEIAKAARAAVASIIEDLNDRSGLKRTWRQVEPDIQHEIREIWEGLVVRALDVPALSTPLIPQSRADAMVAEEREACALIAEDYNGDGVSSYGYEAQLGSAVVTQRDIAAAIRARKTETTK